MSSNLHPIDYIIVILAFISMYTFAFYHVLKDFLNSRKKQNSYKKQPLASAETFFLAGRHMPWYIVAASLFASNIGTEHFVGQAGAAALSGLGIGMYEWQAGYVLLILGWVFAPIYIRNRLRTIPQYLEERYNKWCRIMFVILTLLMYVMTKLGVTLYAGALLFKITTGLNIYVSVPIIVVLTCVYTAVGGLVAVMYTDVLQMGVFVIGGLIGTVVSLKLTGGSFKSLFAIFERRQLGHFTHLVRRNDDPNFPLSGMLIANIINSLWYFCIDQELAQRVLSAYGMGDARLGTACGAMLKALPVFITAVPGLVARGLQELCQESNGQKFPGWCNQKLDTPLGSNSAYPQLVIQEFPIGVKGIMLASFLAAMMSSLSATFNSLSTIFTYDVYNRFFAPKDGFSQSRLLAVGRVTTCVATLLSIAWLPIVEAQQSGLYIVGISIMLHFASVFVGVVLPGLLWRRINQYGAMAAFSVGIILALTGLGLQLSSSEYCEQQIIGAQYAIRYTISNLPFCLSSLFKAIIIMTITTVINVTISLFTPKPDYQKIDQWVVHWVDLAPFYFSIFSPRFKNREIMEENFGQDTEEIKYQMVQKGEHLAEQKHNQKIVELSNLEKGLEEKNEYNNTTLNLYGIRHDNQKLLDQNGQQSDQNNNYIVKPEVDSTHISENQKQRHQSLKMKIADIVGIFAIILLTILIVYFR